ncbi:hypothetical protein XA68_18227 [Ophiocordyceps unilateralis]|uniref:Uncharacterized protein n=1 Tax=Ophiocordyceps unilateralis TaxID=268505 RepID=A0A2A9PRK7_OPHUN|nr:hypothetical protein XA68_18227 [Ophiocordyceps unilateralis]
MAAGPRRRRRPRKLLFSATQAYHHLQRLEAVNLVPTKTAMLALSAVEFFLPTPGRAPAPASDDDDDNNDDGEDEDEDEDDDEDDDKEGLE